MINKQLNAGDLVHVTDFEGRKLLRKAVEILGNTVYICTLEEFDKSAQIGQEPICVGFQKEYVEPCHGNADSNTDG